MSRRLNIGFNQGPTTLFAPAGKYGILRPSAALVKVGSTPPPATQRLNLGWYTVLQPSQLTTSNLIPHCGTIVASGGAPAWTPKTPKDGVRADAGPLCANSAGLVTSYNWGAIDKGGGTYDWSLPDQHLAQTGTFSGTPLWFARIIVRTFDGKTPAGGTNPPTNPMPNDLKAYAQIYSSNVSGSLKYGYQGYRWSPTVRDRFNTFQQAWGARYDSVANFGGVATQETSTGSSVTGGAVPGSGHGTGTYTVNGYTGSDVYSSAGFCQGMKDESDSITNNSPHARHAWYFNFLHSGTKAQLEDVAAHVVANGGLVGGPDLVLGGNVVAQCYPIYSDVHAGNSPIGSAGLTFCCLQSPEWNNGSPADNPKGTIADRMNYGISTSKGTYTYPAGTDALILNLNMIWTDYEGGNAPNFLSDAAPLIAAHPVLTPYP
jgi:hypothetical protein